MTWQNISRLAGLVVLGVELRQVLIGVPIDTELLILSAGLLGIPAAFRGGNGNGGGSR